MPEKETLAVDARVVEVLPNALYRVELDDTARTRVTAHASGASNLLRILPGEGVVVEMSAYDASRARIVRRRR